jgi:hypothetical protein
MLKLTTFRYRVRPPQGAVPGESIKIQVTPFDFEDSLTSIVAVLDDKQFPPDDGTEDAPTFSFKVSQPAGQTHRVIMEFSFQTDAPDRARYEVAISGENDEGCPCGFTIDLNSQDRSPSISFRSNPAQ